MASIPVPGDTCMSVVDIASIRPTFLVKGPGLVLPLGGSGH